MAGELLAAKFVSAEYVAMMLYVPAPSVEMVTEALPLPFSGTVASVVFPAVKLTEPVGLPNGELTVLLSWMGAKASAGFGVTVKVVELG